MSASRPAVLLAPRWQDDRTSAMGQQLTSRGTSSLVRFVPQADILARPPPQTVGENPCTRPISVWSLSPRPQIPLVSNNTNTRIGRREKALVRKERCRTSICTSRHIQTSCFRGAPCCRAPLGILCRERISPRDRGRSGNPRCSGSGRLPPRRSSSRNRSSRSLSLSCSCLSFS